MTRAYKKGKKTKKATIRKVVKSAMVGLAERKHHDFIQGPTGVAATGTFLHLSAVPQGQTDITRIGDQISPTSLSIRMHINSFDATNNFRVVVFRWKQQNFLNPPTAALLFRNANELANSQYAVDTRNQFDVLLDKRYTLVLNGSNSVRNLEYNVPMKKKVQFENGSTTVGTNQIYMFLVSDSGAPGDPSSIVDARLNYIDM